MLLLDEESQAREHQLVLLDHSRLTHLANPCMRPTFTLKPKNYVNSNSKKDVLNRAKLARQEEHIKLLEEVDNRLRIMKATNSVLSD